MDHLISTKEEPSLLPNEQSASVLSECNDLTDEEAGKDLIPVVLNCEIKPEHDPSSFMAHVLSEAEAKGSSPSPGKDFYRIRGCKPESPEGGLTPTKEPCVEARQPMLSVRSPICNRARLEADSDLSVKPEAPSEDRRDPSSRTKERKIGFVIEKVARWRSLYNGTSTGRGETLRMTLEEAAFQVGIPKKSLDDYMLQLRFGKKFGFDFIEHQNEKFGLLRAYVKRGKKQQEEKLKGSQ
jgi:hypothetical protein